LDSTYIWAGDGVQRSAQKSNNTRPGRVLFLTGRAGPGCKISPFRPLWWRFDQQHRVRTATFVAVVDDMKIKLINKPVGFLLCSAHSDGV